MSDDVVTNVWSGAKSEGEAADPSAVKDGALAFSEGVVIGLDLGTSNSCAAVWHLDKGITKVFKSKLHHRRTTPSVVHWPAGSDLTSSPPLVGEAAAEASPILGGTTVRCVKRVLGQPWHDVQSILPSLPFEAAPGPVGDCIESNSSSDKGCCSSSEGVAGASGRGEPVTIGGSEEEGNSVLIRVGGLDHSHGSLSGCKSSSSSSSKDQDGAWVSPTVVSAAVAQELRLQAETYLNDRSHRRFTEMSKALQLDNQPDKKVEVRRCVVGVPVHFNARQRRATQEACQMAGFREVAVMAESTAAAVAYGLFVAGTKTVLVFDSGGGTTDLTLLRIKEGQFEVLATCGNNHLGGEDLDSMLAVYVLQKAGLLVEKKANGDDGNNNGSSTAGTGSAAAATSAAASDNANGAIDESAHTTNSPSPPATAATASSSWIGNEVLRAAVATARVELSTSTSATIACTLRRRRRCGPSLSSLTSAAAATTTPRNEGGSTINSAAANAANAASTDVNNGNNGKEEEEEVEQVSVDVSRNEFEMKVATPFLKSVEHLLAEVLAERSAHEVDEVVLVGGVSRTPCIRALLRTFFPHVPDLCTSCDADTSVAEGLAIRGAVAGAVPPSTLQKFLMSDVLPMDIGVECFDDEEYGGGEGDRGGGRELGQGKDENLEEEETEKSTDVAQAGVTAGEAQLETKASVENEEGGWLDVVLPRLTKLPAVTTRVFRCADPHQRGITVELFEGGNRRARANAHVGRFDFYLTSRRRFQAHNRNNNDEAYDDDANYDDSNNSPRDVLVEISMTEAGDLRVRVLDDDFCEEDENDPNSSGRSGKNGDGLTREDEAMQTFLIVAVCVLGFLYLALRLFLRPITDHVDAAITPFS